VDKTAANAAVVSGHHFVADLTLGYGKVVFDYLTRAPDASR